jgi:hypothetical protein
MKTHPFFLYEFATATHASGCPTICRVMVLIKEIVSDKETRTGGFAPGIVRDKQR